MRFRISFSNSGSSQTEAACDSYFCRKKISGDSNSGDKTVVCRINSYKINPQNLTQSSAISLFNLMTNSHIFLQFKQMIRYQGSAMKTLLLIDDSTPIRERLAEMISVLPGIHIVATASNGQEGVASFQQFDPDFVILDLQMPGINGIDVLRTIKKARPETQAIILTNFPCPQYRDICFRSGADYFFDKSNEFEKVLEILQSVS